MGEGDGKEPSSPGAKGSRLAPPTSLCNEGHLLQGRQKCTDRSPEVQCNGEGLSPPHNKVPRADVLGMVLLIVSCCLEVTALDPQGYVEKRENTETKVNVTSK